MITEVSSRPFSSLPPGAQPEAQPVNQYGDVYIDYYRDDERVWQRLYDTDGRLSHEQGYRNGVPHGACRYWYENGVLSHETYYLYGKEHGTSYQYDNKGDLIGTYTMIQGTGLDQWYEKFDGEPTFLSEERQYWHGNKHGWERWSWNSDDPTAATSGSHYKAGDYHGILREWNTRGRLSRGFPQYYVNGKNLDTRRYLTACKHDPTLPPFRPDDNDCHREHLAP